MHWRNNFLWVLTRHNLFNDLEYLGSFSVLQNPLHTILATTSAASLLVNFDPVSL